MRLRKWPAETLAAAAARISAAIAAHALVEKPRVILGYAPLPREPNLRPFYESEALAAKIAFLRYDEATGAWSACQVSRVHEMAPGSFHVPEPPPHAEPLAWEDIDWVLVPGLAFDRCGRRLGRGGGHYDRILARFPNRNRPWRCGVFFAFQEVPVVPTGAHDQLLDAILTENGLWAVGPR